jgi:hypothetical protein
MEGLHVVGGVTTVSKISIFTCLNSIFKCMSMMLANYHVYHCDNVYC